MKVVIAPDSFKESLTALEAAEAIAEGLRRVWPDASLHLIPMADGGEGTVQAVSDALDGEIREVEVQGPLGVPLLARYAYIPTQNRAIIEMAEASGLPLVSEEERDPMRASTYGTGELILAALDAGCEEVLIGLGGSATIDGGMGALAALGVRFYDRGGSELSPSGSALGSVAKVDLDQLDKRVATTRFVLACDVDNPLLGENGAVHVYGEQKGATPAQMLELEEGMGRWAAQLPEGIAATAGAGAAGGLAAGLLAFVDGELLSGVEYVAELVELDAVLADADLVITGEGAINRQTIHGKTPIGVAKHATCPVVALTGALGEGFEAVYDHGIDVCWPIEQAPCTTEEAIREAKPYLASSAERLARTINIGKEL